MKLYKYMPFRFVESFLCGRMLFRNLTYFRQSEDPVRGDMYEGRHIDRPGGGVVLEQPATGVRVEGDFAFVNSIPTEKIFVLCLATAHDPALYRQFGCDACVEIADADQFIADIKVAARRVPPVGDWVMLNQEVEYYDEKSPAQGNIQDPRALPFFKPERFRSQNEYRLAIARRQSLELVQEIIRGDALANTQKPAGEVAHKIWLRIRRRAPYLITHRMH